LKNKLKIIICLLIIFLLTGCNGTITRNLRKGGYSLNGNMFVCDALLAENEEDTEYEDIKYFDVDSNYMLTETNYIYEISLSQKYSNNQNCRKIDLQVGMNSIFTNSVFKGADNNYYYLKSTSDNKAFTRVSDDDKNIQLYKLFLEDIQVIKVIKDDTIDAGYLVLKTDGNIYSYVIEKENYNSDYEIKSTELKYSSSDYDGTIVDFNISSSNQKNTFIKTSSSIYRMYLTNEDECSSYADVECKYELKKDETLEENWDYVFAYNGSLLITTYGKEFNVN